MFHSKTLSTLLERGGDIRREAFFLACFARYFGGQDDAGDKFEVYEPSLTRDDIAELGAPDGLGLLRISPFRALALDQDSDFVAAYRSAAEALARVGAGATLEQMLHL